MKLKRFYLTLIFCFVCAGQLLAQLQPVVPKEQRGRIDAERVGFHDAANIRTQFLNYGMVGGYPQDPIGVDLSVFHSVEIPKGSGMNYSDGITPFVLARIEQTDGRPAYIMETGFRERQQQSPTANRIMRFEPRPGFFQADPDINQGRSPAVSSDPRTWPDYWPDKTFDPDDPGWVQAWNGYFGKRPNADQESYTVMDDDFYDAWKYYPDSRDSTRRGLGLRIEVRGFQWANPQASNVIFWHYDITNEGTTDYNENIVFGLYFDSGVGGSALSCDGIAESDDDNAFYDNSQGLDLVYTWDKFGHGTNLSSTCATTGYLGYAYLETPGKGLDGIDNDDNGIIDELRDGGPGELITGQEAIRAYVMANYDLAKFEAELGPLENRPAFRAREWWTGDEDLDWVAQLHDTGTDGIFGTKDTGEKDGIPTDGETNFDRTDLHESDQIGLTGFKLNRISAGQGNPSTEVDNIVFFDSGKSWPQRLYDQFTAFDPADRFDTAEALNYNIGFLFASGPFTLKAGKTERFSLALAYGADLDELRNTVSVVQRIYNANYQFAVPPEMPALSAEAGDGYVRLSWDDVSERGADPVTLLNDFEGYRIYRATDPEFRDPRVISTARGTGPIGNGRPIAQFDLINKKKGFSNISVEGVSYYLGKDSGIQHTFTDSTVQNGQLYYYAVTSYDHGSDSLQFYPSENAIAVSRTPRGGTILPKNVVAVRPNPKVAGFVRASTSNVTKIAGSGIGTAEVVVLNSNEVPEDHTFNLTFRAAASDSFRAAYYDFTDITSGEVLFTNGYDLDGEGIGQVASGLMPVISTPKTIKVDTVLTGFTQSSSTNSRLKVSYQYLLPINYIRPGYPDDITISFSDSPQDTSLPAIGLPARSANFSVIAHGDEADLRLKFRFRDLDGDGTLSQPYPHEFIDVITYDPKLPTRPQVTWRVELDTTGQAERGTVEPPAAGDVFEIKLALPLGPDDIFQFTSTAQYVDPQLADDEFKQKPYVVPNPYVGSVSFESERFAVSGRGERRLEFRGLPANCTIRIFTVNGALVQTLQHDGSNDGFVAWNLRTKDNLDVAPGLYIYHVDGGAMGSHIDKFAIIK
ncbi:MAG: hypothetical protein DWQ05_22975 [Calditrichaeota bacterium]|nr:MAG: hypothetical protein DWQ05_22975 [Calditrichota bacterium]